MYSLTYLRRSLTLGRYLKQQGARAISASRGNFYTFFTDLKGRSNSYGDAFIEQYDYDLVVIGGGSGGLACAKEGAVLGKKVAVLDYVTPSTQGSVWGLGGTCVNVGCIPKKIMHQSALLGEAIKDSKQFGWQISEANIHHSWDTLVQNVQNHVRSLNWGHRVQLQEKKVTYFNAKGSFLDKNTIKAVDKTGKESIITAENIVIAVGGRPKIPSNISGVLEHAISSDDLFSLQKPPGKTLIVGASYVALECAGFLTAFGYDISVMVRSIYLRGFDQQMANLIADNMKYDGTKFIERSVPMNIEKLKEGCFRVRWKSLENNEENEEAFDTVMFAIGRDPETSYLQLDNVGVETEKYTKKIIVNNLEQTTVENIYSIGDSIYERPELTPVAIMAGRLLAKRLFAGSSKLMDYSKVPTTIFTPLEYGTVGFSEEDAIEKLGEENIEVYHAYYKPLQYTVAERNAEQCYIKVICLGHKPNTVIGLHFLGPNAGEVVQGFAVAMSCGVTFQQLSSSLGIHPTSAEEIVKLQITKRSGLDASVTGC